MVLPNSLKSKVIDTIDEANKKFESPLQSTDFTYNDKAIVTPIIDVKQQYLNRKYFNTSRNVTLKNKDLEVLEQLKDFYLAPQKTGFSIIINPYTDQFNILS